MKHDETTSNKAKTITISFNGVTYRFSRTAFEGTTASPAFAAVSLPDGRELIYPMWNQGKLGFRYLRRNGCSTCALACLLSACIDPSLTPKKVLFMRRRILSPSPRAVFKPINIAAIILMLQQYMPVDYLDGGSDDTIRNYIFTRARAGIPVIATGRNIPSLYGARLAGSGIHTFVIIGMKDDRTLIVMDSSSYNDQRVKFVDIDALVSGILRSGAEYGLTHHKHFFNRQAGGGLVSPEQGDRLQHFIAAASTTAETEKEANIVSPSCLHSYARIVSKSLSIDAYFWKHAD